jgi:hypothetical protein
METPRKTRLSYAPLNCRLSNEGQDYARVRSIDSVVLMYISDCTPMERVNNVLSQGSWWEEVGGAADLGIAGMKLELRPTTVHATVLNIPNLMILKRV